MITNKISLTILSKEDKKVLENYSNIEITVLDSSKINGIEKIENQTKNLQ